MKHRSILAMIIGVAVGIAGAVPAAAQGMFVELPNGGHSQIFPGAVSLWASGFGTPDEIFQYINGQFQQVSTPTQFANMAVGGGSAMQPDEVWALDVNKNIFRWNNSTRQFLQVPGSLQSIVAGEGYTNCHPYEVWGTNAANQVYRYNYCNLNWDSIPGYVNGLATGGGEVWALNGYQQIFRFNFTTNQFDLMPGALNQLSVGAGGVWGTYFDEFGNPSNWQYSPSAQNWEKLPGAVDQIVAGTDGVFGYYSVFDGPGYAYRFDPSTRVWTQVREVNIFGVSISGMAAGTGAGTWMTLDWPGDYYYVSY